MPRKPRKNGTTEFKGLDNICEQEIAKRKDERSLICKDIIEEYMTHLRLCNSRSEYLYYSFGLDAILDAFLRLEFISEAEKKEYELIVKNIDKMRGVINQ